MTFMNYGFGPRHMQASPMQKAETDKAAERFRNRGGGKNAAVLGEAIEQSLAGSDPLAGLADYAAERYAARKSDNEAREERIKAFGEAFNASFGSPNIFDNDTNN